ncbi:hypothetical protein [Mycobacterium xenopi]|uniref:Secreted protein n=1 Tax=Mycobacterium xenopi TaxID=1789 RepID=A0AAD1H2S6_MYCXE|nr:hypothetical protein [Mycobacterium xenopi]EID17100.1 hypothetical protein MXEN_02954 [Mycobacterium xenopi RIVM700367]MDA3640683.1 hypothetical protein [Mycobacterium xenopi]MDA3659200.1 hypothetical protein [Mycobacterium xenopi]MDA3664225.1 hypothetical protein [Mycobacterium xenopi]SPX88298.1 Uncharacterised protein [Mycobacterium xenopi]
MSYRGVAGVVGALALTLVTPAQAPAQPPSLCLSNIPEGKQVYIPCDLLNARVNYPPGQRCLGLGPLDDYPPDVRAWCG